MLFTTFDFSIFILIAFILYWIIPQGRLKLQNLFLLIAGYIYYGWWDWKCLLLLIALSSFNFFLGFQMVNLKNQVHRLMFLYAGLIINIGNLLLFKYFNFFIESMVVFLTGIGLKPSFATLKIILPVGISFYTFLSLSYLIDIYKKRLIPPRNIIDVLLSLSFFPVIMAGPIHRPVSLLPQIQRQRQFTRSRAVDGLRQILWGLFMKVVVADQVGEYVDKAFTHLASTTGATFLIAMVCYAIQIYADFSGYSNMAIGIGKLFGFDLMKNFNNPYFAKDISDFWKRWNISLTTWFRDYVFLSVAYRVSAHIKKDRVWMIKTDHVIYITGISVTWFLTGLWHGARLTFIIWGLIHGLFLVIHHIQKKPRKSLLRRFHIKDNSLAVKIPERIITLGVVLLAWIFFRAESTGQAITLIHRIVSGSFFRIPELLPVPVFLLTVFAFVFEWQTRDHDHVLAGTGLAWPRLYRWSLYYSLLFAVIYFSGRGQQFIYYQF
jgi:alginate O-acetyltransferase complex protein AlgI